jgi:hypothetical protein
MNNELKITLIASMIIFSGVGLLAFDTMNAQPVSKTLVEKIIEEPPIQDKIVNKYVSDSTQKTNDTTRIVESNIILKIPTNNTIPFGTIKGTVDQPTTGHPVIIQFFKSLDESPVHVAQVNLNDDNTFEYKFRILSIDDGITTHIFSGDYQIRIFTTVNILK